MSTLPVKKGAPKQFPRYEIVLTGNVECDDEIIARELASLPDDFEVYTNITCYGETFAIFTQKSDKHSTATQTSEFDTFSDMPPSVSEQGGKSSTIDSQISPSNADTGDEADEADEDFDDCYPELSFDSTDYDDDDQCSSDGNERYV